MPDMIMPNVLSWGTDIEWGTILQAGKASRMPFVEGHIALMPDAHIGIGSTVGSVIPTQGAIMPAAVGVDIGCGMIATETDLHANDLPDDLSALMPLIEKRIPAGLGKGHDKPDTGTNYELLGNPHTQLSNSQLYTAYLQFGTLGSGNHFVEVCLDERGVVWTVLHSGSRGIGNQLARQHIDKAKGLMKERFIKLEDPDLAYFVQAEPEFKAYIDDMLWSQKYAMESRAVMAKAVNKSLFEIVPGGKVVNTINCHHNFTQMEHHKGKNLWITRKGAIKAGVGDLGVIPGSMGTKTYIVSGNGIEASYNSCSHGAGRRMSRRVAKESFDVASLNAAMEGKTWNSDKAASLIDEHPGSYKDIETVMADQKDLVRIEHTLHQVLNYKGT